MSILQVKNLNFSYDTNLPAERRLIFSNLSLSFNKGEFVSILGPSGSGKSTLLRILSGLLPYQSGELTVEATKKSFVFQDSRLLPWRTVYENIKLPFELGDTNTNLTKEPVDRIIQDKINLVKLTGSENLFPHQLSGGMKQRVSLARSLVLNPQLVFFDEPFSALDEVTRFNLQKDVFQMWLENQWNAFFVTHSLSEAAFLSQRIFLLKKAKNHGFEIQEIQVPNWERTPELRFSTEFNQFVSKLSQEFSRELSETSSATVLEGTIKYE